MFERYTEKARRAIFFGRYEASQFGSPYIETEHLLLGLMREDKALADRFLLSDVDSVRNRIVGHREATQKVSTSVDLPLSHACKRALAYGAEEAQRFNHKHIGTEHLLLGLLREENCFAAQLLNERGVTLHSVRAHVPQSEPLLDRGGSASFARLDQWLADREARGGIHTAKHKPVGDRRTHFAIYPVDEAEGNAEGGMSPARVLEQIQRRIESIVEAMERAVANHEFEKARFYSDEERKERETLMQFREQFNLEQPPPRVPRLCIEIIVDERFSEIQRRCDAYIAEGVAHVWLLEPHLKRAYTVTKAEGFREFRGEILQIANPPLALELRAIFD